MISMVSEMKKLVKDHVQLLLELGSKFACVANSGKCVFSR